MARLIKIKWQGKVYEGSSWKRLLKDFEKDEWFGSVEALIKRVNEFYGVSLDTSSAERIFKHLAEIGELTIVSE